MNRFPHDLKLLIFVLLTSLLLVACERPVPGSEGVDENATPPVFVPTTAAPVLPTQIPVQENTDGAGEQQPETDPAAPATGEGEAAGGNEAVAGGESGTDDGTAAGGESSDTSSGSEPAQPTAPSEYIVQPGDTMFTIASRYNISVEALAAANNITNVNSLSIGDTLTIPGEGTVVGGGQSGQTNEPAPSGQEQIHTVQAGENLYRIGLQYGFTVAELATYNNLANPNSLAVGQQIRIPAQ